MVKYHSFIAVSPKVATTGFQQIYVSYFRVLSYDILSSYKPVEKRIRMAVCGWQSRQAIG